MLLSDGDSGDGGTVVLTVVVSVVLWAVVSALQYYRLCWPDFQCETDPTMYPYLVVFNRLCVAHCNCLFFCFHFRLFVF